MRAEISHPPSHKKATAIRRLTVKISTLRRLSFVGLLLFTTCSLSLAQEYPWHNAANPEDVNAEPTHSQLTL